MPSGHGSPWWAVLVGFPFALLMLWVTLRLMAGFAHQRAALASMPTGTRGAAGLLRTLVRAALGIALFGPASVRSGAMVPAGLMNDVPAVGLMHPYATRAVDDLTNAAKSRRQLERVLRAADRSQVELALATGADPGNRGDSLSLPVTTEDPKLTPVPSSPTRTPGVDWPLI